MFAFSYYTMLSAHDLILSLKLFFILLFFVLLGFLSFRFFIFSIFLLFTIYLLFHTHICIFNHVISLSSHIVVSANTTQVKHPPTICKYINRHQHQSRPRCAFCNLQCETDRQTRDFFIAHIRPPPSYFILSSIYLKQEIHN